MIYAADICLLLLLLPAASSFVVVVDVVAVVDRTSGEIVKQIEPSVANCEPHASNAREKLKRSRRAKRAKAVVVAVVAVTDAVVGRGQTQWPTSRGSDVLVLVCACKRWLLRRQAARAREQLFDVACSACQTAADGSALNRQVIEIAQLVRE